MKIARGLSVLIEYELKVKDGEVIESSERNGPLRYTQGEGKMLPGLEQRLEGLSPGDERAGEIPAREAFGTEESLPVKEMARKDFPGDAAPAVGAVFEAQARSGRNETVAFKVVAVTSDKVTVRFLHPLVGRDIEFKVKVLAVDDPKARKPGAPPPPPGVVELDLEEVQEP
jgi:FKBP-type peptidyl-prolyl cis-trans isomerase 2